ncbi:thiolase family protein [Roseibium sp. AS2]|uniref:thiolase family protein n=1 Tax=Roseibium sp. AS2 TaxID=3135781 RepID=UPI00317095C7
MTGDQRAVIVAARRTAVAPRGGALARLQADELAAPVLRRLLDDAGIAADRIDNVLLGNALYGGGNPARLAALRAGLSPSIPALTLDTQCCSGLDAIVMAARLIGAGAADCVLAGGMESFSRAPVRMHRSQVPGEPPVAYDRPAFAPPPFADPDLAQAAALLAADRGLSRQAQVDFAVASHRKAVAARAFLKTRLITDGGRLPDADSFTRDLSRATALRAPILAGPQETGLSAATIACEADGAAAVLVVSQRAFAGLGGPGLEILAAGSAGGDPEAPALAPVAAGRRLMKAANVAPSDLAATEIMEAYAVQAMVNAGDLAIEPSGLNWMGGGLARGHPIGASGAILAVNLFDRMLSRENAAAAARSRGMALIAAAGGLASGMVVEAVFKQAG